MPHFFKLPGAHENRLGNDEYPYAAHMRLYAGRALYGPRPTTPTMIHDTPQEAFRSTAAATYSAKQPFLAPAATGMYRDDSPALEPRRRLRGGEQRCPRAFALHRRPFPLLCSTCDKSFVVRPTPFEPKFSTLRFACM